MMWGRKRTDAAAAAVVGGSDGDVDGAAAVGDDDGAALAWTWTVEENGCLRLGMSVATPEGL